MVDVFSGRLLVSKDGRSVDPEEALQNKVVGLYFSAGWCSPCRDFTPVLCDFYTDLLEECQPPAPFEVVFISSDHSAEEMVSYMHSMHGDWLALPFHDPYKQSWRMGEVPEDWKIASVTSVFKKGKNEDLGNYAPVSLTSVPGKVVKELVLDVSSKQLEEKKFIRSS
uniref:Nucleoredoxin like 2 n=1 Tax=Gallus gallus TaxID=9031 RepID=A0A8V0Y8F6_CHICK